jgi:hypothetical protein
LCGGVEFASLTIDAPDSAGWLEPPVCFRPSVWRPPWAAPVDLRGEWLAPVRTLALAAETRAAVQALLAEAERATEERR